MTKGRPAGVDAVGSERSATASGDVQSTRERVLDVARKMFAENGYERTTVAAIARQLDIKAPALYWHFASKEEILFSIIEDYLARFVDAASVDKDRSPDDRLREMVRNHVLFQLSWRSDVERYEIMIRAAQLGRALTADHRKQITALQRTVLEEYRAILRSGVQAGCFLLDDVTVTAFALITMCEQVVSWYRPEGRLEPAEIAAHYVSLAERMVGMRPATS
ncbi:TetR/AcrR family transcriptional regulator [Pseudonocardia sp. C8]|uniref:TetR/AcrR family transcriptional regulator n=1 Tax=Pseudonocardia sp. C8 TaxID=2762759 RepID=UPI0016425A53|nr:TetR/AcrR family transcriptional regulator [Pseudonocardia sp. C8]MBC3190997.1 TetR/AcrR family transcriptional regulator [Pseudonocardia sp. C8]